MVYGIWYTVFGIWYLVFDYMAFGIRYVEDGIRYTENGARREKDSRDHAAKASKLQGQRIKNKYWVYWLNWVLRIAYTSYHLPYTIYHIPYPLSAICVLTMINDNDASTNLGKIYTSKLITFANQQCPISTFALNPIPAMYLALLPYTFFRIPYTVYLIPYTVSPIRQRRIGVFH